MNERMKITHCVLCSGVAVAGIVDQHHKHTQHNISSSSAVDHHCSLVM